MKSRLYVSAIAVILSGCGGGGNDSPGVDVNPTAASNPPAASPAPAPAPAAGPPVPASPPPASAPIGVAVVTPPPPVEASLPPEAPPLNEPVKGPVAPPSDPPAPPPLSPAQVVPTVPGAVIINALRTPRNAWAMSSATAGDNFFSEAGTEFNGSVFNHHSDFLPLETPFGGPTHPALTRKSADMQLSVAVGPDAMTFAGSGSITYAGATYSLQGPQYSVPAQVPLNTPKLIEWKVPGTPNWVRLNAGNVAGQSQQIRICIDIFLPGLDRVSCTHHSRADGAPLGADSIERSAGKEAVHETNDESESPRRVHFCSFREVGRYIPPDTESFSYTLFQFKHPYLYQNRSLTLELKSVPPVVIHNQTDIGNGVIQEEVSNPRGTTRFNRRGNAVERWVQSFGFIDYGYTKTCLIR